MEKKLEYFKIMTYAIAFISGLIFSATTPIIHIYMIQSISEDFYKITTFISNIGSVIMYVWTDKSKENLLKLRMYFIPIVVISIITMCFANAIGYVEPQVRFIVLAIEGSFATYIWILIMKDLWNNILTGSDITAFDNRQQKYSRIGSLIGTFVLFLDISIEIALIAQVFAFVAMGISDGMIYKKLKDYAYGKKE